MNKIKSKRVLFMDPRPKKSSNITGYYEYQRARSHVFAKYFPKYMRNFALKIDNASIRYKMKRMKVIQAFQDHPCSPPLKALQYRLLLGNQARFIKTFCNDRESLAQLIEKMKLFTNLRSIQLHLTLSLIFTFRHFAQTIRTLRKIMNRLKNVKSLALNKLLNSSVILIHAVNASPRFLSSLKSLIISPGPAIDGNEGVLGILKDRKNLLKYVTSLRLPNLRSPSHLESFRSLQNSCPNLTNLAFEFSNRNMYFITKGSDRYSDECFPVEINYLSAIKTFQSLGSLRLYIADTFTFLNDFTCSPSIENLCLNFKECLTKEILTRIDQTFNKPVLNFFETNPALIKFYDKFKSLQNLRVLEIFFSTDAGTEDYQHHNYLSQGILKRISSLQKFSFVGSESDCELNKPNRSPVQDLYLPELLKSCHYSRQTLQTLEIGFGAKVIFSSFNLFSSQNKFPNLSTITLTGEIGENDPSNSEISLFLKQVMTLGISLTTIKLNTFVHATPKSLLSLLQQLNQLKKPESLQLKLQIKFCESKNLKDLGAGFEEIIKELQENQVEYAKLQGVSLTIYMSEAKYAKKFLEVYGKKSDSFKIGSQCYALGYFE